MANEIKELFGTATALTISLASLATATDGLVGRQSTLVDNTTARYSKILLSASIKLGTSPTGNRAVYIRLLRSDKQGTDIITDGAGASDAALTAKNARLIGVLTTGASPSTGDVLTDVFVINNPGPEWGIHIGHDSGVNLDSTGGNHVLRYIGVNPEVQ